MLLITTNFGIGKNVKALFKAVSIENGFVASNASLSIGENMKNILRVHRKQKDANMTATEKLVKGEWPKLMFSHI